MPRLSQKHPPEFGDWETRAAEMAADAERLPPGPERNEAMRKARQLTEAAWMRRTLAPKPFEM